MPYAIRKSGNKYKVISKKTGKVKGTHTSKSTAMKQMVALRINVEAKEQYSDEAQSSVLFALPSKKKEEYKEEEPVDKKKTEKKESPDKKEKDPSMMMDSPMKDKKEDPMMDPAAAGKQMGKPGMANPEMNPNMMEDGEEKSPEDKDPNDPNAEDPMAAEEERAFSGETESAREHGVLHSHKFEVEAELDDFGEVKFVGKTGPASAGPEHTHVVDVVVSNPEQIEFQIDTLESSSGDVHRHLIKIELEEPLNEPNDEVDENDAEIIEEGEDDAEFKADAGKLIFLNDAQDKNYAKSNAAYIAPLPMSVKKVDGASVFALKLTDDGLLEHEVLRTGVFVHGRYGIMNITLSKLEDMKKNFDADILQQKLPLNIDHEPTKGALGFIEKLFIQPKTYHIKNNDGTIVTKDGYVLLAHTRLNDYGIKKLAGGRYPYSSAELDWEKQDPECLAEDFEAEKETLQVKTNKFGKPTIELQKPKRTYKNVLTGCAATIQPFITRLKDFMASETAEMKDLVALNRPVNKKENIKMAKLTGTDPLAALREMRAQFSQDENHASYVEVLDKQIAELETKAKETEEYSKRLEESESKILELSKTLDSTKADFAKQHAYVEELLATKAQELRKAEFESMVSTLSNVAYPAQIEILRKVAEQTVSGDKILKFSNDKNEVEDKSMLNVMVDLLLAMPEEARPKALQEEKTSHKTLSTSDMDDIKTTLSAYELGLRLQRTPEDQLKKMVDAKQVRVLEPGK